MGQNRPGLDIRSLCYHNSVLTACSCLLLPVHPHASAFTGMHGPFAPTAPEGGKAPNGLMPDYFPTPLRAVSSKKKSLPCVEVACRQGNNS